MALVAGALTTSAVVMDELGLAPDYGAQDARVERYINAASIHIASWCGAPLHYETGIVEMLRGYGGTTLVLSRRPVISAAVEIDDVPLELDDFIVLGQLGALYRAGCWPDTSPLRTPVAGDSVPFSESPERIKATYTAGYVTPSQATLALPRTLPEDLEDACVEMVTARWASTGVSKRLAQETHEAKSYTYNDGMPLSITVVLEKYRRIPIA